MRTAATIVTLLLALSAVALTPHAQAGPVCTGSDHQCAGLVCVEGAACISRDVVDRCQLQSDCCHASSLWCPERA